MPHRDLRLDDQYSLGVSRENIEELTPLFQSVHHGFHAMKEMGQLPFTHLPFDEDLSVEINALAGELRAHFDTLVVLGMGGSGLGAKAIRALLGRSPSVQFHLCDNLDPDILGDLFDSLDLSKTLFNVVSKSGETLETMSQFLWVKNLLQKKIGLSWRNHVLVTTDPQKGNLRKLVREEKLRSLPIPSGVGGRFSVLSAVGLFPAAMMGLNVAELLAGARRMSVRVENPDVVLNPAAFLASLLYLMHRQGRNIFVLMPYTDRLHPFAEWCAQLWAESLGKRFSLKGEEVFTGSTPVVACGAKDQHSQLQLYMEGPQDKFILFFTLENFERSMILDAELANQWGVAHLGGKDLGSILNAEAEATQKALFQAGRPSAEIVLPKLDAYSLGSLFYLFEVATVFAGGFYNVNPFDQPGVELGKKLTREIL